MQGGGHGLSANPLQQTEPMQDLAELVELLQGLPAPALLLVTATSCTQRALQKSVVPAAGIPAVQLSL